MKKNHHLLFDKIIKQFQLIISITSICPLRYSYAYYNLQIPEKKTLRCRIAFFKLI